MACGADKELWGIHLGIRKARELNHRQVMIESDNITAIKLIERTDEYDGPGKNLVDLCRAAKTWGDSLSPPPERTK